MAKKPVISSVATGYQATDTINNNFQNVRDAFDNTLSLDGSTPNAMAADIDLNSNDLINADKVYAQDVIVDGFSFQGIVSGAYALLYPGLAIDFTDNTSLIKSTTLVEYADDTAAAAGGVQVNGFYRTGSVVKVRVT
jgi:hypothetical protein